MARPVVIHDVFTAIADPTRRRMLDLLRSGEMTVTEIASSLPVSQPTISEHLRVLRNVGLAVVRKSGRRRIYRLDESGLDEICRWLRQANGRVPLAPDPAQPAPRQRWSPEID
jgi:DNA-binding transcriptional ArsR family regulator